jgi:hypothetical protein
MMLRSALLAELPGIRHGFFTRRGGVSEGVWASLNVGVRSGDAAARVAENRALCAQALDARPDRLVTGRQVHGTACLVVEAPWPAMQAPQVDALVTRRPGLLLGVVTADCAPVLLADPAAGVVGTVHAGWRGALDGVLEATITSMRALGAARIAAAIGPCIAQASYEVGPEFRERFRGADPDTATLFAPVDGTDRSLFDLKTYVRGRLERAGVAEIELLPADTCADEYRFFSFRRTTKRGEGRFGLQLSAIGLG